MAAHQHLPNVIDLLDSSSDDEDDGIPLPIMPHRPIEIDSDDEDDDDDEYELGAPVRTMAGAFPADDVVDPGQTFQPLQERLVEGSSIVNIDGEEIFIPDEEPLPQSISPNSIHATKRNSTSNGDDTTPDNREFTAEECLQHVLEIFPDIDHDHVRSLYAAFDHEGDYEVLAGRARLDNIVEQLVSSTSYPKQQKGKLKRKRGDSVDDPEGVKKWERADRGPLPAWTKGPIAAICKADFPAIPRNHISERLSTHVYLFQTYVALAKDMDDSEEGTRTFGRGRPAKVTTADADTIAANCGYMDIEDELVAARLRVIDIRIQREASKAKKRAEEENLRRAIAAGETAECSACFDDLPMNRQIHCEGESAHFTCFGCAETYIKTEVGDSRCNVLCPSGCGAGFAHNQLNLLEDKQLLDKLAQIKQEQEIRNAGLEDLEECPYCDFKAIMPPVEEDFEFRCANPECEKVSCRRCKAISHIPISCEQHAKENKLSSRHQIEEAMTAALVRSCNKCKKQFIKESGCNKMHCTSCGSLQCYVCSATVKDYNHFDQGQSRAKTSDSAQSKKCPLYDNVEERHEREVKAAEDKARAEVLEKDPDVSAEDLEIKVSDAVKKAESERLQRGAVGMPRAYMGGMPIDRVRDRIAARGGLPYNIAGGLDEDGMEDMILYPARGLPGRAPRAPLRPRGGEGERQRREVHERHMERLMGEQQLNQQPQQDNAAGGVAGVAGADAHAAENVMGGQPPNPFAPQLPYGHNAAQPLQGYIPVYFRDGPQAPQAPQYAQQPPLQPPWAQAGGLDGVLDGWADAFNVFAGYDGHPPPPPPARQQVNAAAPNNVPAANAANQPSQNAVPNRATPAIRPRPPGFRDFANDVYRANSYVPGAYPAPVPPRHPMLDRPWMLDRQPMLDRPWTLDRQPMLDRQSMLARAQVPHNVNEGLRDNAETLTERMEQHQQQLQQMQEGMQRERQRRIEALDRMAEARRPERRKY